MDMILHFGVSFILTSFFIGILVLKAPKVRNHAPRFWHSEKQFRRSLFTLVFAFSIAFAFLFGVAKEWLDGLGFGNVEIKDIIFDLLGVWLGTFIMLRQLRSENKVKRTVSFHSQSHISQSKPGPHFSQPNWDDPDDS